MSDPISFKGKSFGDLVGQFITTLAKHSEGLVSAAELDNLDLANRLARERAATRIRKTLDDPTLTLEPAQRQVLNATLSAAVRTGDSAAFRAELQRTPRRISFNGINVTLGDVKVTDAAPPTMIAKPPSDTTSES